MLTNLKVLYAVIATELYNSKEGTYVSLPQFIVEDRYGRRKVLMTLIYVYFCFEILGKK